MSTGTGVPGGARPEEEEAPAPWPRVEAWEKVRL